MHSVSKIKALVVKAGGTIIKGLNTTAQVLDLPHTLTDDKDTKRSVKIVGSCSGQTSAQQSTNPGNRRLLLLHSDHCNYRYLCDDQTRTAEVTYRFIVFISALEWSD
jgi:hypothetical protein